MGRLLKENAERNHVVEIAHSWLGTPYHPGARVKGGGVDCLTILAETFAEAGLISRPEIPHYPKDWHLHRDAERYLDGLLGYTAEIEGPPLLGDIALWKFGRCFSHGAIVVAWPMVIHACAGRNVCLEDAEKATWLTHIGEVAEDRGRPRPVKFFSFWGR